MGVILSDIEYCCVLALPHLDAYKSELMNSPILIKIYVRPNLLIVGWN